MTAYQITSMMEGVVQRGTATVVRDVGKPIAGKTGTTNDEKDVWFIGFSPDIVCGVYMGFDKPRHIARLATGGHLAAPIVTGFPEGGARRQAADSVPVPPGIKLIRVDAHTGMRAGPGDRRSFSKRSSPAPRRRIAIRSSAPTAPTACPMASRKASPAPSRPRSSRAPAPAMSFAPAPADCINATGSLRALA